METEENGLLYALQGPAKAELDNTKNLQIEELMDAYGDDILRLCLLYLGDRQLAEDAFQETMVKAWQKLPTFRGESSAKTWLSHIAVNTCRDMLRSGWLRMMRRSEAMDVLESFTAPGEGEDAGEVTQAVLSLPGKYREIVVLYYYQDMKIREIADVLKIPVNSVSTRLRRARGLLGKTLKGDEEA